MECRYSSTRNALNLTTSWTWIDPWTNQTRFDLPKCSGYCRDDPIRPNPDVKWKNSPRKVCPMIFFKQPTIFYLFNECFRFGLERRSLIRAGTRHWCFMTRRPKLNRRPWRILAWDLGRLSLGGAYRKSYPVDHVSTLELKVNFVFNL